MKKGLIALALIALLVLFVIGCKAPSEEPEPEAAEEPNLTGDITEIDNLESDISEEELSDIESSLDEISW